MPYSYDADQTAAIDRLIDEVHNIVTSITNGERGNDITFNKRLNEIQGVLAYLQATKQFKIHVGTSAPVSPEVYELWIDSSTIPASYLYWDGLLWKSVGATNLDGLGDVEINNPQLNQVLKYDGSKWINDW